MSRANVAGLHDTATMTGTPLAASSRACACAPCRGGSNTTASKRLSSVASSGFLNRSRRSAATGLSPVAVAAARSSAATAASSASTASTRARAASRSAKGPTPANRSATFFVPAHELSTRRDSSASPSAVACKNAAGGRSTVAAPMRRLGTRVCAINSPWRVNRARFCRAATRASAVINAGGSGPEPRTSMSRPASVAVTAMSSGLFVGSSSSAIAQAALSAPSRLLARIGQRSMAIT